MGGRIDTFFWERFGGALLLSIVGDAGDAVSNRVSGVDQTMETPNTAAAIAAQDSQRIRPRLTAPQGREMTIMVARDVDFSQVSSLRLRRCVSMRRSSIILWRRCAPFSLRPTSPSWSSIGIGRAHV